jgi:NAD(P)-dependent dehydrogenase (short-subunit alcohol dehydrogenase family)
MAELEGRKGPPVASRVAMVTGATGGIGAAIALALARNGHPVALVGRSEQRLDVVRRRIAAEGGRAVSVTAQPAELGDMNDAARSIAADIAPPLILVNAIGSFGPIAAVADTDPGAWLETMRINLDAPFLACRAVVPGMLDAGWGRIVNVSSAASLWPAAMASAYGTSKAALNFFTRCLAVELEGTGVTANVVHPGEVMTSMWRSIADRAPGAGPAASPLATWARWVEITGGDAPEKAVDLVCRLVSDDASDTNGQFCWIKDPLQAPIPTW